MNKNEYKKGFLGIDADFKSSRMTLKKTFPDTEMTDKEISDDVIRKQSGVYLVCSVIYGLMEEIDKLKEEIKQLKEMK